MDHMEDFSCPNGYTTIAQFPINYETQNRSGTIEFLFAAYDINNHEIGNSFFQSNNTKRIEPSLFHTIQFNEQRFYFRIIRIIIIGIHKNQWSYSISNLSCSFSVVRLLIPRRWLTLCYSFDSVFCFFFHLLSVFSLNLFFLLFINIQR